MRFLPVVASLALAASILAVAPADAAKKGAWEPIGSATVTDRADHDLIAVTAAQGSFRAIQVRVFEHAVEFRSMTIHFANGEPQEVELRQVIPARGQSRVIDVEGKDRVIRSIEFRYDSQAMRGQKAVVRILGKN